jgi:hypothetical protein
MISAAAVAMLTAGAHASGTHGSTSIGAKLKMYPLNRAVVRGGCEGAYRAVATVDAVPAGALHYTWGKYRTTCSFPVKTKGLKMQASVVFTRPKRCLYRLVVTIRHAGSSVYHDSETVESCV